MRIRTLDDVAKQNFWRSHNADLPVRLVARVRSLAIVIRTEYRLEDLPREQRRYRAFLRARTVSVDEGVARARLVVAHARRGHAVRDQLLGVRVAGIAVVIIAAVGLLQDRLRHPVAVRERHALAVYRIRRQRELTLGARS